jgi:hypothetical protein
MVSRIGPRVAGGAAWGLFAGASAVLALAASDLAGGAASVITTVLGVPLGIVVALAAGAVVLIVVRLLAALPARFPVVLSGCSCVLFFHFFAGSPLERAIPTLATIVPAAAGGAAVGLLFASRSPGASRRLRLAAIAGLAASVAAAAIDVRWLLAAGELDPPAIDAAARTGAPARELDLPDPSRPGEHRVRRLFYGSGADRRRPEYGPRVDLRTRPVDGRPFLRGWDGLEGWARTRYWGFDASALPVDGRLWVPEGEGPFPLVIVVHGMHPMEDGSEPGYDYLGEHLASHGFVAALIDEDFLNTAPWSIVGGGWLDGANAARGFLVLAHLGALRGWNGEAGGLLHGKVDLGRVALIGHSKGGEAIATAAAFNGLPCHPDDANLRFEHGFGIRALVALSATDSQYLPGGSRIALDDVDYLALQGSDDGDVRSFYATAQYERIAWRGGGDHFKAAVYVHHANHGQWNRVWGAYDEPRLPRRLWFNRRPILSAAAQEQVARAYVTAFLDASLKGDRRYLPFLQDHRAGRRWLPDTIYLQRFERSSTRWLARFDEDLDVTTATIPGSRIAGERLDVWREQLLEPEPIPGGAEGRAVFLGWDTAKRGIASYTVTLPEGAVEADPRGSLVLALADAAGVPKGAPREPVDLTIELVDRAGRAARLPLGSACLLEPQLETRLWKGWPAHQGRREIVLQTFDLPLAGFVAEEPALDVKRLAAVRLSFDRTPSGLVALRELGLTPPPP